MRTVSIRFDDMGNHILYLGYAGENKHTRVLIDCKKIFEDYPAAVPVLSVTPPKGDKYPATISREGNTVIWDVTDSDLIYDGGGEVQLTFVEDEVVAKSPKCRTKIEKSIVANGQTPTPIADWLIRAETVLEAIPEEVNAAIEEAKESGLFDGVGISSIGYVSTVGKVNKYRINLTNGQHYDFEVNNGDNGENGVGIVSIAKTGSAGLIDTYTVTLTNGQTYPITVTNGRDGSVPIDDTTPALNKVFSSSKVNTELNTVKSALTAMDDGIGDAELYEYEQGRISASDYYKGFDLLKKDKSYILKVTAHTSGTYTLGSSTERSSSAIVDTIATSVAFTADVPVFFTYTPTADVFYLRLWVCDNWDVALCENKTVWEAIEDSETVINEGFQKKVNFNRIDESKIIPDKYYNSVGDLVDTSNGWVTTGAIPISAGEKLYFSIDNNGTRQSAGMYFVALFSTTGTLLDYISTGDTYYTAQYDGILHFSWKPGTTKVKPFCGTISNPAYYDKYGYSYEAKSSKPYFGVVWACVGDSMTEANSCAKKHYFDYIADELGFIPINYGVGGTGYAADRENNRAFYQRIANITDSFDVLTIFGSVNDLSVIGTGSGQLPLGSYTDSGTTTVAGCINATIDAFYALAPMKKIGIISQPPSVGSANNGNLIGTNAQDYNDMLAQICKNRGIPFLDMFNCSGLRPWDSDYREEYYNEDGVQDTGVHPNSKGQKQLSTKIREFIKTVI